MSVTDASEEGISGPMRLVFGRRPARTLARIVVLVFTCFIIFRYMLLPIRVSGISMEPTYHDGRINFINRLSYVHRDPQRGDVVGIKITGYKAMYLKRIIGLPGERIAIANGIVYINGEKLDEPYAQRSKKRRWFMNEVKLGPDEFYFVGDNRTMPMEDHVQGITDREHIAGKVLR